MHIKFCISTLLLAAAASAQTPAHKDHTLGYDDTPFQPNGKWRVHDVSRPQPQVITPGTESSQEKPGRPPSDAMVLFDGADFSKWATMVKGQPTEPKWKLQDGYMEVTDGAGGIATRDKFGDMQLHIEWASPVEVKGKSQERGNSGVLLMGRYEVQVLDSYNNPTYADGGAASIYGQYPPLVNACRKPGEWQTYDIFFEAPRFDGDKLVRPAYVTVVQNGVLVQNHREILGDTPHAKLGTYKPHPAELPLQLQNHHGAVRYRNIWVRRLAPADGGGAPEKADEKLAPVANISPSVVTQPAVIHKVVPTYSAEARKAKLEGTVRLKIIVEIDGRAKVVKVMNGLGLGLDEKAIDAVQQWEFEPATKNGKAIAYYADVEVNFNLVKKVD